MNKNTFTQLQASSAVPLPVPPNNNFFIKWGSSLQSVPTLVKNTSSEITIRGDVQSIYQWAIFDSYWTTNSTINLATYNSLYAGTTSGYASPAATNGTGTYYTVSRNMYGLGVVAYYTHTTSAISSVSYLTAPGYPVFVHDASFNSYTIGKDTTIGAIWIVKYNAAQVLQWQVRHTVATTYSIPSGSVLGVDSSSNLYYLVNNSATTNYIYKLNSAGTFQWGRSFTPAITGGVGIAVSTSGDTIVAGGGYQPYDIIVFKVSTSNAVTWANKYTIQVSKTYSQPTYTVLDSAGNIYVMAGFVDMYLNTNQKSGVVILKINSSGVLQWARYVTGGNSFTSSMSGIGVIGATTDGTNLVLNIQSTGTSAYFTVAVPCDGSKLGSYGSFDYQDYTSNFVTTTNPATGEIVTTTSSITLTTAGYGTSTTNANSSLTVSTLPAITPPTAIEYF